MSESPKLISQRFTPQAPTGPGEEAPEAGSSHRDPEQVLEDSEKTARFKAIKKKKANKKCCNCNAKFPQWASASFGILICMNCSGKHRFLGPNISFVRSVAMDKWKAREMRTMELGGNRRFLEFLEAEMIEGEIDYDSPALRRFKSQLALEVAAEFTSDGSGPTPPEQPAQKKQTPPEKAPTPHEEAPEESQKEPVKQAKPLEEQRTKVVMAKKTEGESGGGKRGRRRGKKGRFAGKRVAKVDLGQLVTDDLKVKSRTGIKKKGMFEMEAPKETQPAREAPVEGEGQIKKKKNNFLSSGDIQKKIQKTRLNKFSGFGSDNLTESAPVGGQDAVQNVTSDVYGGYGSDDLGQMSRSNVSRGQQSEPTGRREARAHANVQGEHRRRSGSCGRRRRPR